MKQKYVSGLRPQKLPSESKKKDLLEEFKTIGIFIAPYSLLLGILYLIGYWQKFSVNLFQYAGLSDVVYSAIGPLLILAIGVAAGITTAGSHTEGVERMIGKIPTPILLWEPRGFSKYFGAIFYPIFFLTCYFISVLDWRWKWVVLPCLVTLPLVLKIPLSVLKSIPWINERYHQTLVLCLVIALPLSYGYGWQSADDIKSGRFFFYVVESNVLQVDGKTPDPEMALRFIGHIGEYDFFYNPTGSAITIAKIRRDNFLSVREFKAKGADPVEEWFEKIGKKLTL